MKIKQWWRWRRELRDARREEIRLYRRWFGLTYHKSDVVIVYGAGSSEYGKALGDCLDAHKEFTEARLRRERIEAGY